MRPRQAQNIEKDEHAAEQQDAGRKPQHQRLAGHTRPVERKFTVSRDEKVEHLLVGLALFEQAANLAPQIRSEKCVRILDGLVLALQTTNFIDDLFVPCLQFRVVEGLVHVDRERQRRAGEQRKDKQ
jgi:hypothetical protein